MHHGSCLCGAIHYRIDASFEEITHCHCGQCRKAHGAPFGTYLTVRKDDLHFSKGADQVKTFNSSPGVARTFCPHCGSTLQWMELDSELTAITPGTLDSLLGEIPQRHIYVGSKSDWYHIADGLPVADED